MALHRVQLIDHTLQRLRVAHEGQQVRLVARPSATTPDVRTPAQAAPGTPEQGMHNSLSISNPSHSILHGMQGSDSPARRGAKSRCATGACCTRRSWRVKAKLPRPCTASFRRRTVPRRWLSWTGGAAKLKSLRFPRSRRPVRRLSAPEPWAATSGCARFRRATARLGQRLQLSAVKGLRRVQCLY